MIEPNPPVMAPTVSAKPTPEASPRYRHAMINEITGSTLNRMIKTTTSTMAMAVWMTMTMVNTP